MIRRLLLCLILLPGLAQARQKHREAYGPPPPPTPPEMCETAITAAEAAHRLPSRVLLAIGLRESGQNDASVGRVRPWPWTVNFEGVGHYYPTREEAIEAVRQIQAGGGQSIDVGCMQVNLMHHATAFSSIEEAFDPKPNALYAGRFLKGLFASMGDWGAAIAAYHSRTPGKSEAYRDQVVASWRPSDPAVLAHLTMAPAPLPGETMMMGPFPLSFGGPYASLAMAPADRLMPLAFGQAKGKPSAPGAVRIGPNTAYRAFTMIGALPGGPAYRSFLPPSAAYADFGAKAQKTGKTRGGLDMRVSAGGGHGLVVPKGIVERTNGKPVAAKPAG